MREHGWQNSLVNIGRSAGYLHMGNVGLDAERGHARRTGIEQWPQMYPRNSLTHIVAFDVEDINGMYARKDKNSWMLMGNKCEKM
jgi:hypothetical protein